MENNPFKSSLFGGFRRKDVIAYIEKSAAESGERITALEEAEGKLSRENETLRGEVASVTGARDRLSDALSDNFAKQEALQAELDGARGELDALRGQLEALTQERDRLRDEVASLRGEVEALRARAQEYDDTKAGLAELELAAHQRADECEADARQRAEAYEADVRARADAYESGAHTRADEYESDVRARLHAMVVGCRSQCDLVMAALGTTCENLTAELQKSTETILRLPDAFQTLRRDLDELEKFE